MYIYYMYANIVRDSSAKFSLPKSGHQKPHTAKKSFLRSNSKISTQATTGNCPSLQIKINAAACQLEAHFFHRSNGVQKTNKEHFTSMSVSGLKKYQIKPLFKVIFTLVRGNWKAGAYGNMDERLLRQLWHHTPFTLEKDQQNRSSVSMTKEVQGRRPTPVVH